MPFRDAVFVITEEVKCPLYNLSEELRVSEGALTVPTAKATCLILAGDLLEIVSQKVAFEQFDSRQTKKNRFGCGGCVGNIHFEFKKEKQFTTPQMKMLANAMKREKIKPIAGLIEALKKNEIFTSLGEQDLLDLANLLVFKNFEVGMPVVRKDDPGTHLYIVLSGRVEIVDDDNVVIAEIGLGGVFGEVSLLTGDKVASTIVAGEPTRIALLSRKNFNYILKRFPTLQTFFFKLQANRIKEINMQRGEELSSGMIGYVSDIPTTELFQMLNANAKNGHLRLELDDYKGVVVFHNGEVVCAKLADKTGKDAFYDILGLKEGRFKFVQGLKEEEERLNPIGGFMSMLMEGMQRLDEQSAHEDEFKE